MAKKKDRKKVSKTKSRSKPKKRAKPPNAKSKHAPQKKVPTKPKKNLFARPFRRTGPRRVAAAVGGDEGEGDQKRSYFAPEVEEEEKATESYDQAGGTAGRRAPHMDEDIQDYFNRLEEVYEPEDEEEDDFSGEDKGEEDEAKPAPSEDDSGWDDDSEDEDDRRTRK
jgi:hypothetical protein